MTPRRQGLALVGALLVVAVATALGYEIVVRHTLSVAQGRLTLDSAQARQYAFGGEAYARQLLYEDWEDEETRRMDTLLEVWAGGDGSDGEERDGANDDSRPERSRAERRGDDPDSQGDRFDDRPDDERRRRDSSEPTARAMADAKMFEIAGGSLELHIEDLGRRFNLNAVGGEASAENVARLKRLFTNLGLDPEAVDAWRDWVDPDREITGNGAEDADYMLRDPPMRAANQRGHHASELIVAASLTSEQYETLRPHVAVLPVFDQRINVNTVAAEVLAALVPNFAVDEAQILVDEVREYEQIEPVIAAHAPLGAGAGALAVVSEYFRVQARAVVGDARSDLTSVLRRDPVSGVVTVLSRSFGEPFEAESAPADEEDDEDPSGATGDGFAG